MKNERIRAFTLVELLVVISIIAMLLAVLMPALSRARDMAKSVVCTNNVKQVGLAVAAYQAENQQQVPVVFSRYQITTAKIPMKNRLVSLALYSYLDKKVPLTDTTNPDVKLSPDIDWYFTSDYQKRMTYYSKLYMPKYFKCPFGTGTGVPILSNPSGTIKRGGINFNKYQFNGQTDSYSTYLWEYPAGTNSKMPVLGWGIPNYATTSYPKFATLAWHSFFNSPVGTYTGGPMDNGTWNKLVLKPAKWDNPRRVGAVSLSSVAVSRCELGEVQDASAPYIFNYGSHKKGVGGTNVLLADTHVEWVDGSHVFN